MLQQKRFIYVEVSDLYWAKQIYFRSHLVKFLGWLRDKTT